jgi:hypothetical protein
MSTTSPADLYHYTVDVEAGARSRRFLTLPPSGPTGRSRSIPRRPQVAPTQIRRVVSTHNLKDPHPLLLSDTAPVGAVSPFTNSSFSASGYAHGLEMYLFGNVDHDQLLSADVDPDHTTRLSPVNDRDVRGGGHFVLATPHCSSWMLPGREGDSASQPGSSRTDNFLTAGDFRLHSTSAYYDSSLADTNSSFVPPETHMVSSSGSDSTIDPSSTAAGPGVEVDGDSPLTTGDTTASRERVTQQSQSASSVTFRKNVGSTAMVEACRKRRKLRDGRVRLFVCEIQDCGRNFTARHNLSCRFLHYVLSDEC